MDKLTTQDLISLVTEDKHREFLDLYPKCKCMISETAKAMGINRGTVFYWLNRDDALLNAFNSLKKDLEQHMIEKHLNNIHEITFDTNTPPQTRLLGSFFELKALDSRYKDRQAPSVYAEGDIIFQTNMPGEVIEGDYTEIKQIDTK